MIKVYILLIASLLNQATGPVGQSKQILQTSLEECSKNEHDINSMKPENGVQFLAKCIEFDFVAYEKQAAK